MSDLIQKAEEKAAREIERAKMESGFLDMVPATVPAQPSVMVFQGVPNFCFQPESFSSVLEILRAFDVIPAHDIKNGAFRSVTWDENKGKHLGTYESWVELSASVLGGQSAKFRAFVKLSDGTVAQVSVDFDGATYATQYQNRPWHKDLGFRFINMRPRAVKYFEYRADGGAFLALAASVVNFSTGSRDGSAVQRRGYFATLECLDYSLATLSEG